MRSVTEVEARRSVAEGVDVLAEVDGWVCDAEYSLDASFSHRLSHYTAAVILR